MHAEVAMNAGAADAQEDADVPRCPAGAYDAGKRKGFVEMLDDLLKFLTKMSGRLLFGGQIGNE